MQNVHSVAFIGLGSNLDNPEKQLNTAIDYLKLEKNIIVLKQSSFYGTKPYGYLDQNDFLNAVIQIQTSYDCWELLKTLQSIERKQKRLKTWKWGPRVIDLDILCYDNLVLETPELCIPHPGIKLRDFVLQPWTEIAPDWVLPDGSVVEELYRDLISEQLYPPLTRGGAETQ